MICLFFFIPISVPADLLAMTWHSTPTLLWLDVIATNPQFGLSQVLFGAQVAGWWESKWLTAFPLARNFDPRRRVHRAAFDMSSARRVVVHCALRSYFLWSPESHFPRLGFWLLCEKMEPRALRVSSRLPSPNQHDQERLVPKITVTKSGAGSKMEWFTPTTDVHLRIRWFAHPWGTIAEVQRAHRLAEGRDAQS